MLANTSGSRFELSYDSSIFKELLLRKWRAASLLLTWN